MKQLGLKLLRNAANYSGGAATGIAMAAATGGSVGAFGLAGLIGVIATCVVGQSVAESAESNDQLSRIEAWLEELVRRHGRLDAAVRAIVEGRETNQLVNKDAACTLLAILDASHDSVGFLVEHDVQVRIMLSSLSDRLEKWDQRSLTALEQQADQLERIDTTVHRVAANVDGLHEKVDTLIKGRDAVPTEDELAARAIDEQDSCRLRIDALQALFDQMEHKKAGPFADRCQAWLERPRSGLSHSAHAQLLERLLDEALVRTRSSDEHERAALFARVRQLGQSLNDLAPLLEGAEQLRVTSHVAYVESVVDSASAGLARLDGRSDPYAIRRRVAILSDAERHAEAIALFRGATPAPEWVEKGLVAAIRGGEWSEAERLMDWALIAAPPRVQRMARLLFVEAVVLGGPADETEEPTAPPKPEIARLERSRELLQPMVDEILALSEPRYELDYCILRLATEIAVKRDDTAALHRIVPALTRRRPFDLSLGILAVRGRIDPEADWPRRLRAEGKASFERKLVATALEGRQAGSQSAAFAAAVRLAEDASTDDQRKRVHGLLMELAQQLGEAAEHELEQLAPSLVGANDRQARLWGVTRMLRAGRTEGVDELLEELRSPTDPLWLQLHGQRQLQTGKPVEGVADLAEAARILDQPDVLAGVGALALAHKQWERAVPLLERFLVLRPGDKRARASLAMALHQLAQYTRAGELLTALSEEQPDDPSHAVNAASCLVLSGRPEDAVTVLSKACERSEPPIRAVIGLAQLLVERDRPKEAFALVDRHRLRFWNKYEFVGSYWSIALAAEQESAGHEAFVQMRVLQATGDAPADIVVEKSLDELIEMSQSHRERERTLASAVLQGRAPWLMVAAWRHEPAYRAWAQRTGDRQWLFEHPVNLSDSAIYCTNGFTAVQTNSGRHLVSIESTGREQAIVADLTGLITLEQLGMLRTVVEYCGRIHVPETYLFKMFLDNDRLRPHQPSRRTVLTVLRQALAEGRIQIDGPTSEVVGSPQLLDEHYPQDARPTGVYHLADLLASLRESGVATDELLARLASVAHRPQTAPGDHEALRVGDPLVVTVSTLGTLQYSGLLDTVISEFRVHLSAEDHRLVQGESVWFEKQERLRAAHRTLWHFLRDDAGVERHTGGSAPDGQEADDDDSVSAGLSLESLSLSQRLGLPLLADDRCLQAAALHGRPTSASAAFGTVDLLASMANDGHITREEHADHLRALLRLRYRFIVPDPEILLLWARRSLTAAPGPDLQALAAYLHSCLRDPGLFGGLEPTDPPSTIAMRFHQAVETAVGEFIGSIWADEAFPEDRARSFTAWSLAYLLPSPPAVMEPRIRMLGDLGHPLFWFTFLIRIARSGVGGIDRVRRGVLVVGDALGMTEHAVVRAGVEIIDGIGSRGK